LPDIDSRRDPLRRTVMRLLPLAGITLLMALLTLNRLGASDVCGGSEAAMAVYVQQMIEHDKLLFPLDNCTIPMYKPPLYHWTATGLAALTREATATPFNLRLPSALYAVGGAMLTMALALELLGPRGAILAGLILCGSYQYISQARIGVVDMTLTFFETLALYSFLDWFSSTRDVIKPSEPRRTFAHYLLAAAMGLGVLAKGPVGAMLPGGAILLFLMVERDWRALIALLRPGPLILGTAIASSWYLACWAGGRYDFLHLQIGSENFGRFFGSLGAMPPWYYLQPLLLNSIPLSFFVPLAVITALLPPRKTRRSSPTESTSPSPMAGEPTATDTSEDVAGTEPLGLDSKKAKRWQFTQLAARFLAIFWIFTVVFFEFAAFKRRAYLLPLWPASAFLLAWWITDWVSPRVRSHIGTSIYRATITMCLVLAAANFIFIPAYELHACGAPFTIASLLRWPSRGFAGESSDDSAQVKSYRDAAAEIDRLIKPEAPLYSYGFQNALEPLVFYLGRCAPPLRGPISLPHDACVIAPANAWDRPNPRHPPPVGLARLARISADKNPLLILGKSAGGGSACLAR
jgi:4-amino-4-deoxy-L-arabinose transferase-like glycosyltransferase